MIYYLVIDNGQPLRNIYEYFWKNQWNCEQNYQTWRKLWPIKNKKKKEENNKVCSWISRKCDDKVSRLRLYLTQSWWRKFLIRFGILNREFCYFWDGSDFHSGKWQQETFKHKFGELWSHRRHISSLSFHVLFISTHGNSLLHYE